MHDHATNFINLDAITILYLFGVGFVGGLVSGFIGSGGAFVLTPGMMSLGVPGLMAVASNMCHKFPKALVGAMKRFKYGQVDVKLGIVLGVSAEAGVLYGAHIQEKIKAAFGDAGSNLYVSVAFVVILATVGGFVLHDAWKTYKSGNMRTRKKRPASWQSGSSPSIFPAPWSISRASMPAFPSCSPSPSVLPRACWPQRSRSAVSSAFLR